MSNYEVVTTTGPTKDALGVLGKIPFISNLIIWGLTRFTGRTELPTGLKLSQAEFNKLNSSVVAPDGKSRVVSQVKKVL